MIKTEALNELKKLIKQDPEKACYTFASGAMFASRDGDESCINGTSQKQGDLEIEGVKYTIYLGGEK